MKQQPSNGSDQAKSSSPSKYRKLNGTVQSSSAFRTRIRLFYAILFVIIWIGTRSSSRKSSQQTTLNDSRENSGNIAMDALNLLIEQGKLTKDDVSSVIQEARSTRNMQPANHDICNNKCLWRMGTNGTWIQDWEYARKYGQYLNAHFPNGKVLGKQKLIVHNGHRPPFYLGIGF